MLAPLPEIVVLGWGTLQKTDQNLMQHAVGFRQYPKTTKKVQVLGEEEEEEEEEEEDVLDNGAVVFRV